PLATNNCAEKNCFRNPMSPGITSTLGILTGAGRPSGNLGAGTGLPSRSMSVNNTGTMVGIGTFTESRGGGPGAINGCGTGTPLWSNTTGKVMVVALDCNASPMVNWKPRKSLLSRTIPAALISSSG